MKAFYESNRITILNPHVTEKSRFMYFQGMLRKTVVLKVLGNSWKRVFSRVHFKQFEISNLPSMNTLKTVSANVSCEFSR